MIEHEPSETSNSMETVAPSAAVATKSIRTYRRTDGTSGAVSDFALIERLLRDYVGPRKGTLVLAVLCMAGWAAMTSAWATTSTSDARATSALVGRPALPGRPGVARSA